MVAFRRKFTAFHYDPWFAWLFRRAPRSYLSRNKFLYMGIQRLLNWAYMVCGDYGIAIVLITIGIRLCLVPLGQKQRQAIRVQKELSLWAEEIREKYRHDTAKRDKELEQLYQWEGTGSLGSLLPGMKAGLPKLWKRPADLYYFFFFISWFSRIRLLSRSAPSPCGLQSGPQCHHRLYNPACKTGSRFP